MPLHSTFLKYYDGVCRHGSIRKAATHLHISPTAINRAILNFEEEIKHKLFERNNEGMTLTPAGKILYSHISRTLNDAQATLSELQEMLEGEDTQIKVGGAESIISSYLPCVMIDFFKANPGTSTSFTPCTTERAIERLEKAVIDIAVVFDPIPSSRLTIVNQQKLSIGAVLLPEHPLAALENVTIEQCADYPIIMPEKTWSLRHHLDKLFEQKKLKVNVVMESGSTEILQSMVKSKIGVGFHTIVGIENNVDNGKLSFLPLLTPHREYQSFALCIHPDKRITPVLQSMIDFLIQDLSKYKGR